MPQQTTPEDPHNSAAWEAMDIRNRLSHLREVAQLPDEAIVRVTPRRGYVVQFKGRDYIFPRAFHCTYGEAKVANVQVIQIVDANPVVDAPPMRAQRGRGLNRVLGDSVGLDRAE